MTRQELATIKQHIDNYLKENFPRISAEVTYPNVDSVDDPEEYDSKLKAGCDITFEDN